MITGDILLLEEGFIGAPFAEEYGANWRQCIRVQQP